MSIQGIPWVLPKVQTVEEVAKADPSEPAAGGSSSAQAENATPEHRRSEEIQSGKLPIQDLLEKYLAQTHSTSSSEERGIAVVSQKTVALSEEALEQAWALRRLAEWSSSARAEELPQSSRWKFEIMVRDHLSALRKDVEESRQFLSPILSSLLLSEQDAVREMKRADSPEVFNSTNAHWAAHSLQLFATVERIVHFSLGLFADTNFPIEQREAAMQELQSAFVRSQKQFQSLESQIAGTFPERPDSLTLKGRMK
jgi:hypothetical protein